MTSKAEIPELAGRPIYRTVNLRAEDVRIGDVTRNAFGKWDVVTGTKNGGTHVELTFETKGKTLGLRTVALVAVQVVKPS